MLRNLLIFFFFACFALQSAAESNDPFGKKNYGSFLYFEATPNALYFFDEIRTNDSFELRKALRNHEIEFIILSSPGGNVWEGLNMAGIIHDQKLTTYIPEKLNNVIGTCASACAFMFFGGENRLAKGRLGVHQFFSTSQQEKQDVNDVQSKAQFTVSEIIGFLNEFGTPPFVYERMFQQNEMYFFSSAEMQIIGDNNKQVDLSALTQTDEFLNKLVSWVHNQKMVSKIEKSQTEEKKPTVEPTPVKPPVKEIKKLSKKEIVSNIQSELNRLGCNAGSIDGIVGRKTRAALYRFAKGSSVTYDESLLWNLEFHKRLKNTHEFNCPKLNVRSLKPFYKLRWQCNGKEKTSYVSFKKVSPNRYNWFDSNRSGQHPKTPTLQLEIAFEQQISLFNTNRETLFSGNIAKNQNFNLRPTNRSAHTGCQITAEPATPYVDKNGIRADTPAESLFCIAQWAFLLSVTGTGGSCIP